MTLRSLLDLWEKQSCSIWSLHCIISISVMLAGILQNRDKFKLLPSRTEQEGCFKSFVNVLASDENDIDSNICCSTSTESFSTLCLSSYPPLYKRLSKLPDAWIIPLFPIIIRGIYILWKLLNDASGKEQISPFLRRIILYMVIFIVRGFILYVGLNWLEDKIITPSPSECWFKEYARRPTCKSMEFDFSDHTVLYMGQILPVFLFEMVYFYSPIAPKIGGKLLSRFLTASLIYLYFIAMFGEYQTAAYFHTGEEIIFGCGISLIIQCPLAYMQCSQSWSKLRERLFGITSAVRKD